MFNMICGRRKIWECVLTPFTSLQEQANWVMFNNFYLEKYTFAPISEEGKSALF